MTYYLGDYRLEQEPEDDDTIDPYEDYDGPIDDDHIDEYLCAKANDVWMRSRGL